ELEIQFAVEFPAAVLIHEVPLVERDDQGLAGIGDHGQHALVLFGDRLGGGDEQDADLGGVDDAAGAQGGIELMPGGRFDLLAQTGGVDELPHVLVQLDDGVNRVDGGAGDIVHHGAFRTGELVQQ